MSRSLTPLFARHTLLRAVIDAALEGRGGRITVGRDLALLEWGCYRVPGGDATLPEAGTLLASLDRDCEIVAPADDPWRELALVIHRDRVRDHSMRSYVPGRDLAGRTRALADGVPAGYDLAPLDARLAAGVGKDLEPHGVEVMGGPARFAAEGLGRVLLRDGAIACAATSYAVTGQSVEVAIATHPDHRNRGLAACAASALIQEALVRGLEPHWNAFNPVSQRLADRLGFAFAGTCGVLELNMQESATETNGDA